MISELQNSTKIKQNQIIKKRVALHRLIGFFIYSSFWFFGLFIYNHQFVLYMFSLIPCKGLIGKCTKILSMEHWLTFNPLGMIQSLIKYMCHVLLLELSIPLKINKFHLYCVDTMLDNNHILVALGNYWSMEKVITHNSLLQIILLQSFLY